MSAKDIEADFREMADKDVVRFDGLIVEGKSIRRPMLQDLLRSLASRPAVANGTCYGPREIAAEIRNNKNAHAVLWHPRKKRCFLASEMHREAAKALLDQP